MASGFQEQLALLRERIARIADKYSGDSPRPEIPAAPAFTMADLPGAEVETSAGRHWEMEKLYERHRRHGSYEISDLAELPHDLFGAISDGVVVGTPPETWAFLDTETTGLAGGSGTLAFLIGVGRITPEGFRVKQFFLRDHGEEASALDALAAHLRQFRVMVTYNGKAYDQPLLETRFRMVRARPPFGGLEHVDLLHSSRRLWKLRLESCRLVELENRILGIEREGDIPGQLIPYVYFDYLRKSEIARLVPVFHHNAMDILTLACLCGIVPRAFRPPEEIEVKHGAEMAGLARWWRQIGEPDHALRLFRDAVEKGLPDELMFRTLWDIALLEKKLGRHDAALPVFRDLAATKNEFRVPAIEELAKYYERRERNFALALEMTNSAIELAASPALERRKVRLSQRIASSMNGRLL
jgi:uncharacterized protein YprB with RNaseH-like and TPR domain